MWQLQSEGIRLPPFLSTHVAVASDTGGGLGVAHCEEDTPGGQVIQSDSASKESLKQGGRIYD